MIEIEHELFWREVVFLTLVAIFSFTFYYRSDNVSLHVGFMLLSLVFYFITLAEEKRIVKKSLHEYFKHTSSYFILSTFFFLTSLLLLIYLNTSFILITLAIAVILFSAGFMRLLFARLGE